MRNFLKTSIAAILCAAMVCNVNQLNAQNRRTSSGNGGPSTSRSTSGPSRQSAGPSRQSAGRQSFGGQTNRSSSSMSRPSAGGQVNRPNSNMNRPATGSASRPAAQSNRQFAGQPSRSAAGQPMRQNITRDNHMVRPRERDFMQHERIGSFWGRDPHYFGYRVHSLPPRYTRVRYYGIDYYRYGNVFYRPFGGYYVVCRPPFGVVVNDIVSDIVFNTVRFAFYNNVYRTYNGFDSYSMYIDSQNRRIAENNAILAQQNNAIAMNSNYANASSDLANALGLAQSYAYADQEYYYSDGVFYIMKNGQYQTIVPPAGALVETLPEDYETITLGGGEYYRVDDTVYRMTVVDGHPYFEVLGQMYGSLAQQNSLF